MKLSIPLIVTFLLFQANYAWGFHYCEGKITNIVTRATAEGTSLTIEGMNGWVKIGYGGDAQKEMHKRQFNMLLSAYMTGSPVKLEFSGAGNCSGNHHNLILPTNCGQLKKRVSHKNSVQIAWVKYSHCDYACV